MGTRVGSWGAGGRGFRGHPARFPHPGPGNPKRFKSLPARTAPAPARPSRPDARDAGARARALIGCGLGREAHKIFMAEIAKILYPRPSLSLSLSSSVPSSVSVSPLSYSLTLRLPLTPLLSLSFIAFENKREKRGSVHSLLSNLELLSSESRGGEKWEAEGEGTRSLPHLLRLLSLSGSLSPVLWQV